MTEFTYGPVELHLVLLPSDRPDAAVLDAMIAAVDSGAVRMLDLAIVSRSEDGDMTVTEITEADELGETGRLLLEAGLAGLDDLEALAEAVPPGASAAVVAFEQTWARDLAAAMLASGAITIRSERIPADAVNEVLVLEASTRP